MATGSRRQHQEDWGLVPEEASTSLFCKGLMKLRVNISEGCLDECDLLKFADG